MESPYKGKTGLRRLVNAARYSLSGLVEAARHEDAFRQELMLAAVLVPLGLALGRNGAERALLAGSVLLVLVVELLNSAIEATVDRVSLEDHRLAKRAKDLGSAAVMLALAVMAAVGLHTLFETAARAPCDKTAWCTHSVRRACRMECVQTAEGAKAPGGHGAAVLARRRDFLAAAYAGSTASHESTAIHSHSTCAGMRSSGGGSDRSDHVIS